jgi:signal transduction histidine kinase
MGIAPLIGHGNEGHTMQRWHQQQRWIHWLIPRPFYLISSALYLGVFFAFLIDFAQEQYLQCGCQSVWQEWLRLAVMTGAIVLFFALDRVEYRLFGEETPLRAALILFVIRILLYEGVAWSDDYHYSLLLTLFLTLQGLWYFGSLIGVELAILACLDYAFHQMANTPNWVSDPSNLQADIVFLIALGFTLAVGQVLVRERASRTRSEFLYAELEEAHQDLEEAHQQLRLYAGQVEELATAKERNRLAREIHDGLGHYLTIINVQLEKALSYRDRNPDEEEQAVRDAKRLASEALQDVRHSVSTLRGADEAFVLTPALHTLVDRLRSAQLAVEIQIEGSEAGYSQQALMALFRVAQEGLTNIQKYAHAASALLHIHFGEAHASLSLSDDGLGFDLTQLSTLRPGREGSYGLQGVRERLELLGGTVQVESSPGQGTRLNAIVPKDPLVRNEVLHREGYQEARHEPAGT